jgi:hypothetical protein
LFIRLGTFIVILAAASVTARSQAASKNRRFFAPNVTSGAMRIGSGGPAEAWPEIEHPTLLPLLAKHEAVFGRFIRPEPSPSPQLPLPANEACPPDMVEVEGDYCPVVEQKCLRWLDAPTKLQCAEFEKKAVGACPLKAKHERYCIDRFEWPNRAGAMPTYMASWQEAKASCESAGKRLCDDTEWTLACEGPQRQPYPYGDGYTRDPQACNIDRPYIWPHAAKLFDAKSRDEELERLDQREASGSRPACVSPFGVHDMVGNVDEWVVNASQFGKPFVSGLKGGYWGPVRTRCRPMTTAHDETFRYYQIGFRCCDEARPTRVGDAPVALR